MYTFDMKKVSIKSLREEFARWAEIASGGEVVEITKHNRPFLRLVSAWGPVVRIGSKVGAHNIRPALQKGLRGLALKYLFEDRENR